MILDYIFKSATILSIYWNMHGVYQNKYAHTINPFPAQLFYLIFNHLRLCLATRDPQSQVVENYLYLLDLRPNINKY